MRTFGASLEHYKTSAIFRSLLVDARVAAEAKICGADSFFSRSSLAAQRQVHQIELKDDIKVAKLEVACGAFAVLAAGAPTAALLLLDVSVAQFMTIAQSSVPLIAVLSGLGSTWSQALQALKQRALIDQFETRVERRAATQNLGDASVAELVLEKLTFGYDINEPVLACATFTFKRGVRYALLGDNGSGKSTLLKLIAGLYTPQQGRISANGCNIFDLGADVWRSRIAYVPQSPVEVDATLMDNMTFGRAINPGVLECALSLSGIAVVSGSLPNGLRTMLSRSIFDESRQGATLSGGQWRRVGLARAQIRSAAEIVLFDEPSEGLDTDGLARLKECLLSWDGIVIVATHSRELAQMCDEILIVRDGGVERAAQPGG